MRAMVTAARGVESLPIRHHLKYWTVGRRRRARTFEFDGRRFAYHVAAYNTTWENERAVELPIALDALRRHSGARVLEVGNVLKHYVDSPHDVVDKYERSAQAFRMDVLDFQPEQPYDLIVSISTFEHIGFDEEARDPDKVRRAIEHVTGLLAPGGELLISAPLGYNPSLDELAQRDALGFGEMRFLKRVSDDNRWVEVGAADTAGARYDSPFPKGNLLLFGRTAASTAGDDEDR
jgi:SAM-dependent methyltransferase